MFQVIGFPFPNFDVDYLIGIRAANGRRAIVKLKYVLLRGIIANRTYGTPTDLYIYLFLLQ